MKKINNYFKNLFKTELNKDLFKISLTIFIYLIIGSILKAGYEFQRLVDFKTKPSPTQITKYNYTLIVNGSKYQIESNGTKDLLTIIESRPELNVDILSYFSGTRISSINNSKNVTIFINGKKIENNQLTQDLKSIANQTEVVVNF
jgi:hypothetical protein